MTYPFYYIFGRLPKFFNFSGGMAKSYSVEQVMTKKSFFELQKIPLNNFPPNVSIWIGTLNAICKQKIRIGHWAKFRDKNKINVLCKFYFRFVWFYAAFHFRYFARVTFTRNFVSHSWRMHSRHVLCRLSAHAWLKTLSSFLKNKSHNSYPNYWSLKQQKAFESLTCNFTPLME